MFEYERPFVPELSDDYPIFCAKYSPEELRFYIAGQKTLKVWNALKGRPIRVIDSITTTEVTAICLDDTNRKVITGDHNGRICMYDALSGIKLKDYSSHESEVTDLYYVKNDKMLISVSWDRKILIHNDSLVGGIKEKRKGVVRSIANAHTNDITCLDYHSVLDLIATGSRDFHIKIWDYETCKLEGVLSGHQSDILTVKFLSPYPLLVVSDQSGTLSLWAIMCPQFENMMQCLVRWRNMHTLAKTASISAINYYIEGGVINLLLGDEKGNVRILQISDLLEELDIKPLRVHPLRNKPRNHTRMVEVDMLKHLESSTALHAPGTSHSNPSSESNLVGSLHFVSKPLKDDQYVRQIAQWKAHNDGIKYITIIKETEMNTVFTASLDHMAKLWDAKGEFLCVLKQGSKGKLSWHFPLKSEINTQKNEEARDMLRRIRHNSSSYSDTRPRAGLNDSSLMEMLNRTQGEDSIVLDNQEMMRNLEEVEKLLPKDTRYNEVTTSRSFRLKKVRKNY